MKITALAVNNYCGIRSAQVAMQTPITMFIGPNGAGKSSLIDAIRLVLTEQPTRILLKKDYGKLVKEGAKMGNIAIYSGDSSIAEIKLPSGDCGENLPEGISKLAMGYVLDMNLFANALPNDRRAVLFSITGCAASPKLVADRLLKRGCDSDKVETIKPILRAGFDAAHKEAKNRTTEARGAWKATTGETYGDKKAEDWKAERPAFVDDDEIAKQEAALKEVNEQHDANTQQLGSLEQQWRDVSANVAKIQNLHQKAEMLPRAQAKLATDEIELARIESLLNTVNPTEYTCPCCSAALIKKGETLLAKPSGSQLMSADKITQYEKSLLMLKNAVANDKTAIADAEAAQAELTNLGNAPDLKLIESNIEALRIRLNAIKADRQTLQIAINKAKQDAQALADANTKNSKAATYHAEVQSWTKIAEALAPDGIPGELLTDALKAVNARLRQSADDTGWKQVVIDSEMNITADGRIYALLSESEQWRVNVVITEMISHLSGLKLMVLDRMDVLDLSGRGECVQWLDLLADEGDVDSIIVAATLKELPKRLPSTFQAYWLADGEVQQPVVISEAA